jgi:N-acetylglucosamine kinase-like BadF-type ATPase
MKLLAGIDGGGTRTRLALVEEGGVLLGYAGGPCASFAELGVDRAKEVLHELWRAAWAEAHQQPRAADALFIGSGSVLSDDDARVNCELVVAAAMASPEHVRAGNDALNALAGGLLDQPGILLIAGTGSACLGRNGRGETWRAGGWGHLLDDRGSAYALARAALIAVTRDADGRDAATALTSAVLTALQLRELREIYRRLHLEEFSRATIAAFAPQVIAHAEAGDPVARQIVSQAADGLVEMVATVARRLGLDAPQLALTGGLIRNAASYRGLFLERLQLQLPRACVVTDGLPPVLGAVLLAHEQATGERPTTDFICTLRLTGSRALTSI